MTDPLPPGAIQASAAPGPSPEAPPVRPEPGRTAAAGSGVSKRLLAATLVVAILVAGAVWLDDRRARQDLRADIARRLSAVDTASQASARTESQLATDLRDAQAKIALLEARLAESQQQQASLEALYRDLAPSRDEIALTEIEQILIIASQQLQLAGNVQAALSALQLGEAKLQRMERPQFLPLRRALTRDIERLKAVPFVDVSGMSVKLDQSVALVDKLPLARDERLPAPATPAEPVAESAWDRFVRDVGTELRQLVRIEASERPAAPLLPPSQEYFLRENLKLRLLSARVALLNHEDEAFKADVNAAEAWLRQYFDTRTKAVQTLQTVLKQLAATPTAGDIPDLARTLEAMRVLRAAADRAPTRGADAQRPSR
jgi:uroporphyrin-3 C-methyltransferase